MVMHEMIQAGLLQAFYRQLELSARLNVHVLGVIEG